MTKPDFTVDAYSMKMEIGRLKAQLAKANERVRELEEQNNFLKQPLNKQMRKREMG